ncbi:MAG: ArnT family glycosyltransferase [Verrucomicrobiales bacterium]
MQQVSAFFEKKAQSGWRIFFLAFFVHVLGLSSLPLIDRDEPRFAEAAREMDERGDWVIPWLNDQPRYDKPPLIYWLQIACYRVFGETDLAARLPSAMAGAACAVLLAWFARDYARATGLKERAGEVGFWTATVFTLCFQVLMHSKAAVADMVMIFSVSLGIVAAWMMRAWWRKENGGAVWAIVFWLSMGLGFLAKGPIAWTPLVAFVGFGILSKPTSARWVGTCLPGLALMIGIMAAWGIPAQIQSLGDFWDVGIMRHVVERGLVAQEGHGSKNAVEYVALLPFYLVGFYLSFFPWSLQTPWLVRSIRGKSGVQHPVEDRVLLILVLIVFGIFTLYKTKLPHYTLPAFPAIAVLFACRWFREQRPLKPLRQARRTALIVLAVVTFGGWMARPLFPTHQLAENAREWLSPEMEAGAVDFREPSVVWYFRAYIDGFVHNVNKDKAIEFMEKAGSRILVLTSEAEAELFPEIPPGWKRAESWGINFARGMKPTTLVVLGKPEDVF